MFKITSVGTVPGSDSFLVTTATHAALLDTGFAFAGQSLCRHVVELLAGRQLDYVLLTHSHYDHASGSAWCRQFWPSAPVVASAHTARVLERDSARQVMRELNAQAAAINGMEPGEDKFAELGVDRIVAEGDLIDMGELQLRVLELPGHTRCSIGFYDERAQLLLGCETLGVPVQPGMVMPCCLVDYQATLQVIDKVKKLPLKHLLLPHHGLLNGLECQQFLEDAEKTLRHTKAMLQEEQQKGTTEEQMMTMLKNQFYNEKIQHCQPEMAFDLNARYTVAAMLKTSEKE